MKPKVHSLHGFSQNRSWSHFTGIDSEEISHNRIREVGYYLVCVPGRLTLTDSTSWEFIPKLFSSCWNIMTVGRYKQLQLPSPLLSTWPWSLFRPIPNLCEWAMLTSLAALSILNPSVTDRLDTLPNLKIVFLGSTIPKFWWKCMGKCVTIYQHFMTFLLVKTCIHEARKFLTQIWMWNTTLKLWMKLK